MGPKVEPVRCCGSPVPPKLGRSKGPAGGVFLMCHLCETVGPTVRMEDVGESSWWNVAARAWNRKLAKKARVG